MKDHKLSTHMKRNPILFTAYGVRRCQYCDNTLEMGFSMKVNGLVL